MTKNYSKLQDNIYFGGFADAQDAVANENIDIVVDVRVNGVENPQELSYNYKHAPIADEENTAASLKQTAEYIKQASDEGKKVYIHCGGGNGRAGVAATATLMELGAENLTTAVAQVKAARPTANIRDNMAQALNENYK